MSTPAATDAAAGALLRPEPAPDYKWGVLGTTWWCDGAAPRPAPAPDEPQGVQGRFVTLWNNGAHGAACWRDGALTRPAFSSDERTSRRAAVRPTSTTADADAAAAGAKPRPAPASDYKWGVLGARWWRDGVLPRPAPAPDEGKGGPQAGWWRIGAAPRPAPAPDELRGALLDAAPPWCDGARARAGSVAAGSQRTTPDAGRALQLAFFTAVVLFCCVFVFVVLL